MRELILNRNFMLLTFGNLTTKMGTKIYELILAWWLTEKTGSAAIFGIVTAFSLFSVVICNIFSGVIVDQFNKKMILVFSDFVSAIVCIAVGLVVMADIISVPLLIVASLLLGATNSLFSPAIKAILPEIIRKESIVNANSFTTIIGQIITVGAPVLGGFLISGLAVGLGIGFIINGLSFFCSGVSELLIKYQYKNEKRKKNKIFIDLKEGYKYVFNNKWLLQLLYVSALVNLFIAAYNTILPMFFINYYRDNGMLYSYALGSEALFAILAGIFVSKRSKMDLNPSILKRELLLCGIPVVLLQLIHSPIASLILVGLFGYFLTTFNVYFFSIVQQRVDRDKMGRVFSIIFMVALSIMPIGNLFFGLLSSKIITYVFIIAGCGIITSTFIIRSSDLEKVEKHSNSAS
nr:MFS transporter [Terribacillus saccharophilus]